MVIALAQGIGNDKESRVRKRVLTPAATVLAGQTKQNRKFVLVRVGKVV